MAAGYIYTKEQDDFLRENVHQMTYKELTQEFNTRFGTKRSQCSISDRCIKRLHIHRCHHHSFEKGTRNKGVKTCAIGDERWDGQTLWIKISDVTIEHTFKRITKANNPNWEKKSHYVYKQHYGTIPDNSLVVFLNRNKKDCSIENLYCVSRQINFMMAKNNWYSTDPMLTLTAIKWCELFYTTKNIK